MFMKMCLRPVLLVLTNLVLLSLMNTVCHESFEAEKFHGFCSFYMVRETFLYEISRWRCSNMDIRESM